MRSRIGITADLVKFESKLSDSYYFFDFSKNRFPKKPRRPQQGPTTTRGQAKRRGPAREKGPASMMSMVPGPIRIMFNSG